MEGDSETIRTQSCAGQSRHIPHSKIVMAIFNFFMAGKFSHNRGKIGFLYLCRTVHLETFLNFG